MESNLKTIFENFKEYMETWSITYNSEEKKYKVEYTPLLYDLIDDDLDFDEEYYNRLIENIDRMLEVTIKDMLRDENSEIVEISRNTLLSRSERKFEYKKCYMCETNGLIKVMRTTYE